MGTHTVAIDFPRGFLKGYHKGSIRLSIRVEGLAWG